MTINKYTSCLLGLFFSASLYGEKLPVYTSDISNEHVRMKGEQVVVNFTLDLGSCIVKSQHKRIITPVISAQDGTQEIELPPIIAGGRNRALKELRSNTAGDDASNAFCVLFGNKKEDRIVHYQTAVTFHPWMERARLSLREKVTGCACGGILENERNIKEQALYIPQIKMSAPQACPVEFVARHEQRDAFLIYPVNKTTLCPELYGNRHELQKIDSAISYVQYNPDYEIRRIEIAGFASPEGSLRHNIELSEGRAAALRNYIRTRYALPDTLIAVVPGAENWEGLKEALKNFQLPYKEEILDVIAAIPEPDRREEIIRNIGGGIPYRTLFHAIYPGLRKNTFIISYISKERTPEEARRLVFTRPGELNVYEFYRVADTFYANDRTMYDWILLMAADTYPAHSIANNNAARIALEHNDPEKAELYLLHTQNEPFTWNNRGCLLYKQGKYTEALLWWQKAAKAGDTTARRNIDEMKKRGE